jgi:hypothetical protein
VTWLSGRRAGREAEEDRAAARRFLTLMAQCGTLSDGGAGARGREREAREVLAGDPWLDELDGAYAARQGR